MAYKHILSGNVWISPYCIIESPAEGDIYISRAGDGTLESLYRDHHTFRDLRIVFLNTSAGPAQEVKKFDLPACYILAACLSAMEGYCVERATPAGRGENYGGYILEVELAELSAEIDAAMKLIFSLPNESFVHGKIDYKLPKVA